MKIESLKSILGAGVALGLAVGIWSPIQTQAADQVKGAAKLLGTRTSAVQEVSSANKTDMSCPKCKTVAVQNVNTVKGHVKTVTTSAKHLCNACDTKVVTTGAGKAATTAAVHICVMGDPSSGGCCGK